MSALRQWMILAVAIVTLPVCSFAQDQSRVDGRLDGRVESRIPRGFGHHQGTPEPERPLFTVLPCPSDAERRLSRFELPTLSPAVMQAYAVARRSPASAERRAATAATV